MNINHEVLEQTIHNARVLRERIAKTERHISDIRQGEKLVIHVGGQRISDDIDPKMIEVIKTLILPELEEVNEENIRELVAIMNGGIPID